jgi:hypothetical protein
MRQAKFNPFRPVSPPVYTRFRRFSLSDHEFVMARQKSNKPSRNSTETNMNVTIWIISTIGQAVLIALSLRRIALARRTLRRRIRAKESAR